MDAPTKRNSYDRIIEILSLVCLLGTFVPLLFYKDLGEGTLIPIHYNASGQIDGWGDRSDLWHLPVIATLFYIGFTVLERFYKKFNYPVRVTASNAPVLYKLAVRMTRLLKLLILLLFAYLAIASHTTAIWKTSGINNWIMNGMMTGLFAALLFYCIKMIEAKNM